MIKQYLYVINYPKYEESLCKMEIKCLFNILPEKKHFLSSICIDPSQSPFIKQRISIVYTGATLNEIIEQIISNNISYNRFKVCYIKLEDEETSYDNRLRVDSEIGFVINGRADLHDPNILLGITKVNGLWIFGELEKNNFQWHDHNMKPYQYSNALNIRTARAVVNIATRGNKNFKVIDPCCGVGTVLIEALSLGINISGYEINPLIAQNAKKNLEFFGYEDIVTNGDMHTIADKYDIAIVDLPYGLFNPTTIEEQTAIIKTSSKIASKMILITLENMDEHIKSCGFRIIDKCFVSKGKFNRYITVCEK